MAQTKTTVHFIAHTHWDREWYLTFEQFRLKLVDLIDNLLELLDQDPAFTCFHLDGQTIVLDDYAAIRPERVDELEQYIRQGRIIIGPWYEQNDLFLTSAESTVRNLIEGIRTSRRLGGEMKVGYLPDHFGLAGQMPQVFRQIGIDNSVFGRGYSMKDRGPFIRWEAPDGSQVLGILMPHWYNNAQRLPADEEQLRRVFSSIQSREENVHQVPHTLMMNGVDHLEAQENLSEVIGKLQVQFGEQYTIIQGRLDQYAAAVGRYFADGGGSELSLPVVRGELRERDDYSILTGTLSARVYLKQANMEGHHLLEKHLEPLSVLAGLHGLDRYDQGHLRRLWKLYMQNHPHDSICGCSKDAVHSEMMGRYAKLEQAGGDMVRRKLAIITDQVDSAGFQPRDLKLLVANMSQVPSEAVQTTRVYFHAEDQVNQFSLEDAEGVAAPYRIIGKSKTRQQVLSPINLPGIIELDCYEIEWQPKVPALGYAAYRVAAHETGEWVAELTVKAATGSLPVLENSMLRVECRHDGTFDMLDKQTGRLHRGLGRLEDCGDKGDLYVFTALGQPQLWQGDVSWRQLASNDLVQTYAYDIEWELPSSISPSLESRSSDAVRCRLQVELRLEQGDNKLRITVDLDNQAKDHRMRVLFPAAEQAAQVWAGAQYDCVRRQWTEGREFTRSANAQPYWKWVAPLWGEQEGLALFAKGLVEYEALGEGEAIALTLLRGAETIHLREPVLVESDYQPLGQCLGKHRFELAVRPFQGASATTLYREAESFTQGVLSIQRAVADSRWEEGRAWVQEAGVKAIFRRENRNETKPALPRVGKLLELTGDVLLSAIKWAENGSGPAVRLYNVEEHAVEATVRWPGWQATAIVPVNLLEEPNGEALACDEGTMFEIGAKKIVTYLFHAHRVVSES